MIKRFSTLVNERKKEFQTERDAEKRALEEFNQGKNSALDRNVEPNAGFLKPGKIYTFRYNPLTKDKLSYFDKNPVVFVVDRRKLKSGKIIDIAINLNFLPYNAKLGLLDRLFFAYQIYIKGNTFLFPNKAKAQKQLPINWFIAKRLLGRGGKFALRSYYPSRRTNTYEFSYESWKDLMFLNVKDIEGASLSQIYKLYNSK